MKAICTKGHDMKRLLIVVTALILAASATVSCDKLKPAVPPLPKIEAAPAMPQVTSSEQQAPGASAVR